MKTFKSLSKKKNFKAADEKIQTVIADRDLFGRLLIAANSRDVNLREVLSYELSTVPYGLAHADGTLRKSTKSILLTELEKMVNVKPTLPATGSTIATAQVIDGMALVQILKSGGASTFGELADKHFDMITAPFRQHGCNRVDVVFDRYDRVQSIKSGERKRRSVDTPSLEVKIAGPNTPVPKKWNKFVSFEKNKSNLTDFLSKRLCELAKRKLQGTKKLVLAGGFKDEKEVVLVTEGFSRTLEPLKANREEADTRMVLHAKHASLNHERVIVQSPDTDVVVLCTFFFTSMTASQLWFKTGVRDKVRYIPIHELASTLGTEMVKLLLGFHALTGCDSTSGISGIGKKKAWRDLSKTHTANQQITQLGDAIPPSEQTRKACEKFICSVYSKASKAGTTADEMRYWMFCHPLPTA